MKWVVAALIAVPMILNLFLLYTLARGYVLVGREEERLRALGKRRISCCQRRKKSTKRLRG
jgi:hypothetical protein